VIIQWNHVTWYSKIAAIVLFGGVFLLGWYVGAQTQFVADMGQMSEQQHVVTTTIVEKPIATAHLSQKEVTKSIPTVR